MVFYKVRGTNNLCKLANLVSHFEMQSFVSVGDIHIHTYTYTHTHTHVNLNEIPKMRLEQVQTEGGVQRKLVKAKIQFGVNSPHWQ